MANYECTEDDDCIEAEDGGYDSRVKCRAGCMFENDICETLKKAYFSIDVCHSMNTPLILALLYLWIVIFFS